MRLLLAALLLTLPPCLGAQDAPLPPAPADGIYDAARLLDDASRAKISTIIASLKSEVDVHLYLAAYTLLPGDVDAHARRLRAAWLPESRGLIVVYRRGTTELSFSSNEDNHQFIPPANLYQICRAAVFAAREPEEPRQRIVAAVETLANGIRSDLAQRDNARGGFAGSSLALILTLTAVALFGGALAAFVVSRLSRRRRSLESAVRFPAVEVGERLGASFGGGVVVESCFAKARVNAADASHLRGH